jgi:hypothetical protein
MPKIIENLWTRHVIARDSLYYVVFFTVCAQTVDLVFIYISELYNFSVIMQVGKKVLQEHKNSVI